MDKYLYITMVTCLYINMVKCLYINMVKCFYINRYIGELKIKQLILSALVFYSFYFALTFVF